MFDGEDLIFDQRTLEGLGNLYNSLVFRRLTVADAAMVYSEFTKSE
jgi:hypothetical protein